MKCIRKDIEYIITCESKRVEVESTLKATHHNVRLYILFWSPIACATWLRNSAVSIHPTGLLLVPNHVGAAVVLVHTALYFVNSGRLCNFYKIYFKRLPPSRAHTSVFNYRVNAQLCDVPMMFVKKRHVVDVKASVPVHLKIDTERCTGVAPVGVICRQALSVCRCRVSSKLIQRHPAVIRESRIIYRTFIM